MNWKNFPYELTWYELLVHLFPNYFPISYCIWIIFEYEIEHLTIKKLTCYFYKPSSALISIYSSIILNLALQKRQKRWDALAIWQDEERKEKESGMLIAIVQMLNLIIVCAEDQKTQPTLRIPQKNLHLSYIA